MNPILSLPTEAEAVRYRRNPGTGLFGWPGPVGVQSVSGVSAWYHAADVAARYGEGLSRISSGTVPTFAGVGRWVDRIGRYHLTATTPTQVGVRTMREDGTGTADEKPAVMMFKPNCTALTASLFGFRKEAVSMFAVFQVQSLKFGTQVVCGVGNDDITIQAKNNNVRLLVNFATRDTSLRIPSDRRVAVVVTSGPSGVRCYVDAVSNVHSSAAISGAPATPQIRVGGLTGSSGFRGKWYEMAFWNKTLTVSEVATLLRYAQSEYGTGQATQTTNRVVFDGDSLTQDGGTFRELGWVRRLAINPTWLGYNLGVEGQTLATMVTDQAIPNVYASSGNLLFVWGGTNDILNSGTTGAATEALLNTYCTAAISAGWAKANIAVTTLNFGGTAGTTAVERDNFNAAVRSNYTSYAGTLLDVAADSVLGVVGTTKNTPSLWGDATHYNEAGHSAHAAFVRANMALPF